MDVIATATAVEITDPVAADTVVAAAAMTTIVAVTMATATETATAAFRVSQITILARVSRRAAVATITDHRVSPARTECPTVRPAIVSRTAAHVSQTTPMARTLPATAQRPDRVSLATTHSSQPRRPISIRVRPNSIGPRLQSVQQSHRAPTIRQMRMRPKRTGMTKLLIHIHRQPVVEVAIISSTIPMDMGPLNRPIQYMRIHLLRMQSKLNTRSIKRKFALRAKKNGKTCSYAQHSHTHTHRHLHSHFNLYVVDIVFI